MRVPVVDSQGKPVMPCKPAKARHLLKSGQAKPKRNKLGIFYIQLTNKDLELYDRRWRCPSCNAVIDRDANAALNILREGASSLGLGDVRPDIPAIPA